MSGSGVFSAPAWKQALLDRKRRQEDPEATKTEVGRVVTGMTVAQDHEVTSATGSGWRQTAMSKKLQKYSAPSVPQDAKLDNKSTTGSRGESTSNRHSGEGIPDIKIETTGSVSGEDAFVEERLLPIKQNPILLSDRQKRKQPNVNHVRTEKRAQKKSDSQTLTPKNSDGIPSESSDLNVSPDQTGLNTAGDESVDEVFDTEVTYGKGFVHKLLQKFINLSGKDEPPSTTGPSKMPGKRSSGEQPGGQTKSSPRVSGSYKDASENNSSEIIGHSVFQPSNRDETSVNLMSAGINNTSNAGETLKDTGSKIDICNRPLSTDQGHCSTQSNAEAELPKNIVSTARGIFEHHVESPPLVRKKPNPGDKLSSEQSSAVFKPNGQLTHEKLTTEKGTVRHTASSYEPVASLRSTEASRKDNLNLTTITNSITTNASTTKSSTTNFSTTNSDIRKSSTTNSSTTNASHDLQSGAISSNIEILQQNLPMNQVLCQTAGTKKPAKQESTSHIAHQMHGAGNLIHEPSTSKTSLSLDVNENMKGDVRESARVPLVQTGSTVIKNDREDTFGDSSMGMTKTSSETDANFTSGTVSSGMGLPGTKDLARIYDAKTNLNEGVASASSNGLVMEHKGAKTAVKPSFGSLTAGSGKESVSAGASVLVANEALKFTDKPSVVKESVTAARLPNTDRTKNDGDVQSKTTVTSSDTNTTLANISKTSESLVDISVLDSRTNNKGGKDMNKRTAAGTQISKPSVANSFAAVQQISQNSSNENSAAAGNVPHDVPPISSIRTENRVTVIQIGSATPSAVLPRNSENRLENSLNTAGKGDDLDDFRNKRNRINDTYGNYPSGNKASQIIVGYESDPTNTAGNTRPYDFTNDKDNNQIDSRREGTNNDFKNYVRNEHGNEVRNDTEKGDKQREDVGSKSVAKYSNTNRTTEPKSAGASRPGKLLIRPASNHPAAKTKTEFLTMTKFNDIRKGEFAPAKRQIVAEDEMVNGDVVDRRQSPSEEILKLEQFEFLGGGVSIGRSMLTKTKHGKKLRINFDDAALQTHEYPSEQSLMAEIPPQPGYCDYPDDEANLKSSSLSSSPALASNGNLLSYVPRVQVDYEFGMNRSEDSSDDLVTSAYEPKPESQVHTSGLADLTEDTTWSDATSADLLF